MKIKIKKEYIAAIGVCFIIALLIFLYGSYCDANPFDRMCMDYVMYP